MKTIEIAQYGLKCSDYFPILRMIRDLDKPSTNDEVMAFLEALRFGLARYGRITEEELKKLKEYHAAA